MQSDPSFEILNINESSDTSSIGHIIEGNYEKVNGNHYIKANITSSSDSNSEELNGSNTSSDESNKSEKMSSFSILSSDKLTSSLKENINSRINFLSGLCNENIETRSNSSEKFNSYEELLDPSKIKANPILPRSTKSLDTPLTIDTDIPPFTSGPPFGLLAVSIVGEHCEMQNDNSKYDPNDLEQQLLQLREDNYQLVTVLQANNEAMRKNLKIAQGLKSELESSQRNFKILKESTDQTINKMQKENEELSKRLRQIELEKAELSETKNNVTYGVLNAVKDVVTQDSENNLKEKVIKIEELKAKIEEQKQDLAILRNKICNNTEEQNENYFKKYKDEKTQRKNLSKENENLKNLIKKLTEEKINLEEKLNPENKLEDKVNSIEQIITSKDRGRCESKRHSKRKHHHRKIREFVPCLSSGIVFTSFKNFTD